MKKVLRGIWGIVIVIFVVVAGFAVISSTTDDVTKARSTGNWWPVFGFLVVGGIWQLVVWLIGRYEAKRAAKTGQASLPEKSE
jgi:uncharacterized membrane protein